MLPRMRRILSLGRKVEIVLSEIAHETETGILIEWKNQNAWLPKRKVKVKKTEEGIIIQVPHWLYKQKF